MQDWYRYFPNLLFVLSYWQWPLPYRSIAISWGPICQFLILEHIGVQEIFLCAHVCNLPPSAWNLADQVWLLGEHQGRSLPPYRSATPTAATCCLAVPEPNTWSPATGLQDCLAGISPFPLLHNPVHWIVKLSFDQNVVVLAPFFLLSVQFLFFQLESAISAVPFLLSRWTARNMPACVFVMCLCVCICVCLCVCICVCGMCVV